MLLHPFRQYSVLFIGPCSSRKSSQGKWERKASTHSGGKCVQLLWWGSPPWLTALSKLPTLPLSHWVPGPAKLSGSRTSIPNSCPVLYITRLEPLARISIKRHFLEGQVMKIDSPVYVSLCICWQVRQFPNLGGFFSQFSTEAGGKHQSKEGRVKLSFWRIGISQGRHPGCLQKRESPFYSLEVTKPQGPCLCCGPQRPWGGHRTVKGHPPPTSSLWPRLRKNKQGTVSSSGLFSPHLTPGKKPWKRTQLLWTDILGGSLTLRSRIRKFSKP